MTLEKYRISFTGITGNIIAGYKNGFLMCYENNTEMSEKQLKYFLERLPIYPDLMPPLKVAVDGRMTYELIPPDTSFDAFWDAYKKKVNRGRCIPLWKKMSEADKVECLLNIPSYEAFLKRSTRGKLDPENYLKKEAYKNNWNALVS